MAKAAGNQKDIKALEAVAPYPPSKYGSNYMADMITVRTYQSKYGLSVNMGLGDVIHILATPYYSFNELKNSFIFSQQRVLNDQGNIARFLMEEADIRNYGADYQVPVYYIMGANDYNSPYLLAKAFFDEIVAPDKQIFSIPDADHMPFLSTKAEFDRILLEEIALLKHGGTEEVSLCFILSAFHLRGLSRLPLPTTLYPKHRGGATVKLIYSLLS